MEHRHGLDNHLRQHVRAEVGLQKVLYVLLHVVRAQNTLQTIPELPYLQVLLRRNGRLQETLPLTPKHFYQRRNREDAHSSWMKVPVGGMFRFNIVAMRPSRPSRISIYPPIPGFPGDSNLLMFFQKIESSRYSHTLWLGFRLVCALAESDWFSFVLHVQQLANLFRLAVRAFSTEAYTSTLR